MLKEIDGPRVDGVGGKGASLGELVDGRIDRPMKEHVTLPEGLRDDPAGTGRWMQRALEHATLLVPKQLKTRAKKS